MSKPIRERSGSVDTDNKFVVFVYLLGRDYLSLGQIEQIMQNITKHNFMFSNGWLANFANDVVNRLENK